MAQKPYGKYSTNVNAPDNSAFASQAGGSDVAMGVKGTRPNVMENGGSRLTFSPSPKMAFEQGDPRTMSMGRVIRSYPSRTGNFYEAAQSYGPLGPGESGGYLQ